MNAPLTLVAPTSWAVVTRVPIIAVVLAALALSSARAETDEPPVFPDTPEPAATRTPSSASEDPRDAGGSAEQSPGIPYEVKITGIEDDRIKTLMKESSQLIALENRPPTTLAGLNRRAEEDVERFGRVLRSEGYYEGTINHRIDTEHDPVRVEISVDPGPPFLLAAYTIDYVGPHADDPPPPKPTPEELGLEIGARAEAANIVTAGRNLIALLRNEGRPLVRQTDRRAVADFRERTLTVDVSIDAGPAATYGPVTITGNERTKEDYIRQWIPWEEGDTFRQRQLNELETDLVGTGLFASVLVNHADEVGPDGRIAITIAVEEDKPRSVGARIGWSTDRGVGGDVFWRHNNLLGRNEQLKLFATADFLEQRAAVDYERPNLGTPGRSVFALAEGGHSDTDAYEGVDAALSGGIRWPLSKRWEASVGGLVEYSNLKDNDSDEFTETVLWGVPGSLFYDGTDDLLDPKKGVRLRLTLVPYIGTSGKLLTFNYSEVGVSGYYPLDEDKRYILAGRTRVGSLFGESREDIPPNKRLYAGGGNSIRGYAYQVVGPLNDDDDPIGGRSKIEFSAELRARVWGNFGVVPFVAAGNAYESELPEFSENFQWAAGLGFRYYTGFGPLRLDVAFPINPRDDVDDPFQIYVSIGQAF